MPTHSHAAATSSQPTTVTDGLNLNRHILTISVQEYFHVGALEGSVLPKHWSRLESRLEKTLTEILELLDRHEIQATFFMLGWVAERQRKLVELIVRKGHEVASSGYSPRGPRDMVPEEFRHDLQLAREILESAGSNRIVGYRCPRNWFTKESFWALDILAEEGYLYDSSINPILRRFAGDPRRFEVHEHRHSSRDLSIHEFPISTVNVLGLRVAISGGNYIRQYPHILLSRAVAHWDQSKKTPVVFYFRPWEFDREQPRITSLPMLSRIRHYRNLAKTRSVLEHYFRKYRFQPIGDYLGVRDGPEPARQERPARQPLDAYTQPIEVSSAESDGSATETKTAVSLVVPLFNEKQNIAYLKRTLLEFRKRLSGEYHVQFLLVDDGSDDGTWQALERTFGDLSFCQLIQHPKNRGVAAAILTGIQSSSTEIVCSIDCDCSYDPDVLEEMIPLLEDADLVTASPYHPKGQVFNVPRWRLFLSKTLSRLYSLLMRERIRTFTSCCRVYRKSAVGGLSIRHGGFLGVAETLIRLKLNGKKVTEHPAVLESRLFGESKMKVFRTIGSHLRLLGELTLTKTEMRADFQKASETSNKKAP